MMAEQSLSVRTGSVGPGCVTVSEPMGQEARCCPGTGVGLNYSRSDRGGRKYKHSLVEVGVIEWGSDQYERSQAFNAWMLPEK